jgi:hypothetical protein
MSSERFEIVGGTQRKRPPFGGLFLWLPSAPCGLEPATPKCKRHSAKRGSNSARVPSWIIYDVAHKISKLAPCGDFGRIFEKCRYSLLQIPPYQCYNENDQNLF